MAKARQLTSGCWAKLARFTRGNALLFSTLLGAAIGIAAGLGLRNVQLSDVTLKLVAYPGELFTRALKLMILPLVVTNLVVGSSSLNSRANIKIVGRALAWFVCTTIFNACLGVGLAVLIHPGAGKLGNVGNNSNDTMTTLLVPKMSLLDSFLDLGRNIVPSNLFSALFQQTRTMHMHQTNSSDNDTSIQAQQEQPLGHGDAPNTIGVILFALVFGMILGTLRESDERARKLIEVFDAVNQVILVMTRGVMWSTPVGVGSVVASKILSTIDLGSVTAQLGMFSLTICVGVALYQFVILQLAYVIILRKNPFSFYKGLLPAGLTAFATSSTIVTLPLMLECMDKLNVNTRLSHFLLPVAVGISKDASALFLGAGPVFVAQLSGFELDYGQLATIVIAACVSNLAAPGIPSGGISLIFVILNAIGIPTQDIGLLFTIDWLLDRIRTPNSVYGNCYAVAFVEHWSVKELKQLEMVPGQLKTEETQIADVQGGERERCVKESISGSESTSTLQEYV